MKWFHFITFALTAVAQLLWTPAQAQNFQGTAITDNEPGLWEAWRQHQQLEKNSLFHGLSWRSIGPMVQGGRVVDVESIPEQPYGFYVAYASGGVWKTTNNGVSFTPLSDQLPSMITGDIAVDPSNPKRLWIGSGEPNSSRSSYGGMGIFVSDDEGRNFRHAGLSDVNRVSRILVHPKDGNHVCVAAIGKLYSTGGRRGVFCTKNSGASWIQVLKGEGNTGAIDLAMDAKNPEVLYAAMWERSRTAWDFTESGSGSGIYKTDNGGNTWVRLTGGLPDGKHVGRIGLAVSPSNPNIIYASVDNWADLPASEQDLGDRPLSARRLKNMSKEEFLAQDTDEIEAFIRNSDLDTELNATILVEKISTDEITIEDLIAALNDAEAALFNTDIHGLEIYRSDNAGSTWKRTHDKPLAEVTYTYGYYFGNIRVAPGNPEQIYILGVPVIASSDGGKTFTGMNPPDVHVDHHAWWIDPAYPNRMITGNDGGLDISYDGGKTWLKLDRQPVGQFYTVNVDMEHPYNVYGGLQDNGTLKGSSQTRWELGQDWTVIGGGDGMHVAVDTRDNTVYTGYQFGFYNRSGPSGNATVRPREKLKEPALRYNWNTPVILSPHNQDVVYYGANKLFRSFDQGETWTAISNDLTSSKNRGNVPYATITSISESSKQFGLIWVGTDDGNVWVTTGGGNDWRNVSARLPDHWVSRVIASNHIQKRAYVSFNAYRNDDATPLIFVTDDLGLSWRSIASNLPDEAINVVREDSINVDVLYVGTDRGVYVSLDRGAHWQAFDSGLPNVPVHDLIIHPRDREIIAATHGRSVWIADVLPVQDLTSKIQEKPVHLFAINEIKASRDWRGRPSRWFDETPSLPTTTISYWAAAAGKGTLSVMDSNAQLLKETAVDVKRGVNTFNWDLILDQNLALAAEKANNDKQDTQKKIAPVSTPDISATTNSFEAATETAEHKPEDSNRGKLAKTPYAESVRLGHRLYPVAGDYTIKLTVNGENTQTQLKVAAPDDYKPRVKPKMEIRGKK